MLLHHSTPHRRACEGNFDEILASGKDRFGGNGNFVFN